MSNRMCSVSGCTNRAVDDISLHKYPSCPKLCRVWMLRLKIEKPVTVNSRVCSDHFLRTDFVNPDGFYCGTRAKKRLKRDAIPSQHLPKRDVDPDWTERELNTMDNRRIKGTPRSPEGLTQPSEVAVHERTMLFDFTKCTSVDNWTEMSDTVRAGGMSKAVMILQKTQAYQRAIFFSLLNPQPNGAGFAGVQAVGDLDLSSYTSLKMCVRAQGNNTNYKMVLRHRGEEQEPFPTYENYFEAPSGEFGEVELLMLDFLPYHRGEVVPEADPLDSARVTSLGLQVYACVYSPVQQSGPGTLEIDWIAGETTK